LTEEPAYGGIIVAVAEQLQSTVPVRLVLALAHEPERRGRRSRPAYAHAERIVELGVRCCLRAVGDAPC
jgi:hypothetical protein